MYTVLVKYSWKLSTKTLGMYEIQLNYSMFLYVVKYKHFIVLLNLIHFKHILKSKNQEYTYEIKIFKTLIEKCH